MIEYICVSGIKYRVSCDADWRSPELEEYLCGDAEDCVDISVTREEIEQERDESPELATDRNLARVAVLRKVALESLRRDRMLVHGACIAVDGRGFLFTAPSGTGKTTHIRLWKKNLGDEVIIVNGDKPILELKTPVTVYGTPWAGKEGYQTNVSVPLCAVVEIVRGEQNRIRPLGKAEAFTLLYQHSYLGEKDPAVTRARMNAVKKIVSGVPCYELTCDMSDGAFVCAYRELMERDIAAGGLMNAGAVKHEAMPMKSAGENRPDPAPAEPGKDRS